MDTHVIADRGYFISTKKNPGNVELLFVFVLLIACIVPILSYPLILSYYRRTGRVKTSSFLSGIACSAFIYGYKSDIGNDIIRHMMNLQYYVGVPIIKAFDRGRIRTVYIWDIWQWIIAQLHNQYFLQASGALIGYSFIAYMIFDYGKRFHCSEKNISIVYTIALLSVSPLSIANGIRSGNALILCAFAVYMQIVKNKSFLFSTILIMSLLFLHHEIIVVSVLWFAYFLIKKRPKLGAVVIAVTLLTFTNYHRYISVFMGGGFMLASMGKDLQRSVTAYTGDRLLSFHYIFAMTLQLVNVLLLFARGGGMEIFGLRRIERDTSAAVCSKINRFQLIFIVSTCCMLRLLSFNGNRYFLICKVLSFLPFLDKLEEYPFLRSNRFLLIDLSITAFVFVTVLLYGYDMNAGTGELLSLVRSGFLGYLSRISIF